MQRRDFIANIGVVGSIPVSHKTFSSTVLPHRIGPYEYSHRTDAKHLDDIAQNYFVDGDEGQLTIFYNEETEMFGVRLMETVDLEDMVLELEIPTRLEAVHTAHRIVEEHSDYSL